MNKWLVSILSLIFVPAITQAEVRSCQTQVDGYDVRITIDVPNVIWSGDIGEFSGKSYAQYEVVKTETGEIQERLVLQNGLLSDDGAGNRFLTAFRLTPGGLKPALRVWNNHETGVGASFTFGAFQVAYGGELERGDAPKKISFDGLQEIPGCEEILY